LRDGLLIVVNSIEIEECEIVAEIENLVNLRHPVIAAPIGFVFGGRELKIARLHGVTLAGVQSTKPGWWTPTAKVKAIVGMALALRFAHGLGLLHGGLTARNVICNSADQIQITDFNSIRLGKMPFSGRKWSPTGGISGFAAIVFEIVVGGPAPAPDRTGNGEKLFGAEIPPFLSEMIVEGLSGESPSNRSFIDIIEVFKENQFGIVAGVDIEEVYRFVEWIESGEQSGKFEVPPVA
jgi:hypothetical protein